MVSPPPHRCPLCGSGADECTVDRYEPPYHGRACDHGG